MTKEVERLVELLGQARESVVALRQIRRDLTEDKREMADTISALREKIEALDGLK
jgi:Fe-S cluster assembly scaffold protein SufB